MPGRRVAILAATLAASGALVSACSRSDPGERAPDRAGIPAGTDPATGTTPGGTAIAGGIELTPTDPASVFAGDDLAFGAALPSEVAAGNAFADDPEVAGVTVRRVFGATDARHLGQVLVLRLTGAAFFDEAVLAGWERGLVEGLAGGPAEAVDIAADAGLRAAGSGGGVAGFREGDVVVTVVSPAPEDALVVATRMREARRRGDAPRPDPATPMRPVAAAEVFVAVPAVSFVPFPPPEEEPPPAAPAMSGAIGAEGRIGSVGGERRATAWALVTDPAALPTAEALESVLGALVSSRTGGAAAGVAEASDRVVVGADGGDAGTARAFRHGNLAILVEGTDAGDVEAIVTAWIVALGPP